MSMCDWQLDDIAKEERKSEKIKEEDKKEVQGIKGKEGVGWQEKQTGKVFLKIECTAYYQ